jgi:hypothetical protein
MPWMALPSFLQLCRISGCLYTPYVQDQNYFVSFIVDNLFMRRTFQDPAGYPRILDIVDLRPLRGRHTYKASLRSALPDSLQLCSEIGCLYTSFNQDHDSILFSF